MTNPDDLVERVARALCKADGNDPDSLNGWEYQWIFYTEEATTAIAIALEEAAKVVRIALEEHGDPLATEAADRAIRELIEGSLI
jgi:hypothetical protein